LSTSLRLEVAWGLGKSPAGKSRLESTYLFYF
jgi:hypothetical protein